MPAFIDQHFQQFDDKQRIAVCLLVDFSNDLGRERFSQHKFRQGSDGFALETGQPQACDRVTGTEYAERFQQRVVAADLGVAVGAHQQCA